LRKKLIFFLSSCLRDFVASSFYGLYMLRDPDMNFDILSNSYGEDRSGAIIGKELKKICPDANVVGAPLISFGEEYKKRNIKVVTGSPPPHSGGFFLKSLFGFICDLIMSSTVPFSYVTKLRKISHNINNVIVVGDIPLLILAWIAFRKKIWFLTPCKSDYFSPHLKIERFIMRRYAREIFTHDEFTAKNLKHFGLNAVFLGNPMLDELEKENVYNTPENKTLIAILPGSRREAYQNMRKICVILKRLSSIQPNLHFAVAVSSTINKEKLQENLYGLDKYIDFVTNAFVDIVTSSTLVISLSGTASEQTASFGIPIISFVGTGPQTTPNRLRGQEKLLGGCLKFVKDYPDGVVNETIELLSNTKLREEMGKIGMERMGPEGGARKIAERIVRRM
ncbi:lipid-A-disaccharide synthase-related protein, partial [candidate division WOR-3 bacterium]|nr:lipid-A-disaccharide synthase-related protein [candidate division WOR-3 bacterium]